MKVLNFYNCKGGVGKSTLSYLSALFLAGQGKKILVIDADPQRSLTRGFPESSTSNFSLFDFLFDTQDLPACIAESGAPGIDLVPGDLRILKIQNNINQNHIKRGLSQVEYDYVILDNAPTWNALIAAGLFASDSLIVPALISFFDLDEVAFVFAEAGKVNPDLEAGVILNRTQKPDQLTKDESEYIGMFDEQFGDAVMESRIPSSVEVRRIIDRKESLFGKSGPKSKLRAAIHSMLQEVTGEGFQPDLFKGAQRG